MSDPLPPAILHADMDAFFVAVEVLRDPSLRGKPVIVGGSGERGVVASCSYEARAHGIHSAMPSVRARRLCPDAVFVAGDYSRYEAVSRQLHEILLSFTPAVEPIALDEAFLDVTAARRLFGTGPQVAEQIRARVATELGLTCSIGVATVKMLAKLASEAAKPRASPQGPVPGPGVFVVERGGELEFLHPLPVEALWGVGPATSKRLRGLGVTTVGELAAVPLATLVSTLGRSAGNHLHELAWARDPRPVVPDQSAKSIGHEQTYAHDLHEPAELGREAVRMADAVAGRLRHGGLSGRTVTVKVRFHDFSTITRSHTVVTPVDTGPDIAKVAMSLLAEVDPTPGVRLLGVSVSALGTERQLSFADDGWASASDAIDRIRTRFGSDAVGPASLVRPGAGLSVKRRGDQQWGPGDGGPDGAADAIGTPVREDGRASREG